MFKLKQKRSDFLVREIFARKLSSSKKDYSFFVVRKSGWTTPRLVLEIAKRLRINRLRIAVAGLKDKGAVTEQYMSIYHIDKDRVCNLRIKDVKISFAGYSEKPLNLGGLSGNDFDLVVRNLEKSLSPIVNFQNYFDDQRFGAVRPVNYLVGKLLLQRRFEEAMKAYLTRAYPAETENHKLFRKKLIDSWGDFKPGAVPGYLKFEKDVVAYLAKKPSDFVGAFKVIPKQILTLFINSFQSKLFNDLLSDYIISNFEDKKHVEYIYGKLAFVDEFIDKRFPLVGYDFEVSADEHVRSFLVSEGVEVSDFKFKEISYLSSRTIFRKASVRMGSLRVSGLMPDELNRGKFKQKVRFFLPKGSYATMVVKQMGCQG